MGWKEINLQAITWGNTVLYETWNNNKAHPTHEYTVTIGQYDGSSGVMNLKRRVGINHSSKKELIQLDWIHTD